MEMDIARKVLSDIGIVRELVKTINDEDPGELSKVCSTFEPREQYIASLGGEMRLERGNVYVSIYCDKDSDVHIVAYADERLHMYHTEIFQVAVVDYAIDAVPDIGEHNVYVYTVGGLHVEMTYLGRLRRNGIFCGKQKIKMRTRTCSDGPDIGELFEILNGKPTKTTTDLGNAARKIAVGH